MRSAPMLALLLAAIVVALATGGALPEEVLATRALARRWVEPPPPETGRVNGPVARFDGISISPLAAALFVPAAIGVRKQPAGAVGLFAPSSLVIGASGFLLLGVLLDRLLRARRVPPKVALGVTLVALVGSPLLYYARIGDGTTWAAAGLVLALDGLHRERGRAFAIGLLLFVLGRPELLALAVVLVARAAMVPRVRGAIPLGVSLLAIGLAAWLRTPDAGGPLTAGLYGLVLSTGKSLFLYAPWLALAVIGWRAMPLPEEDLARDLAILAGLGLVVIGERSDWHGGQGWGPRLYVVLLPALALPLGWLAARARRLWLPLLGGLGALAQLPGLLIPGRSYAQLVGEARVATGGSGWFSQLASDQHFVPQLSPLVGHTWLLAHRVLHTVRLPPPPWTLIYQPMPAAPNVPPPTLDGRWATLGLDWWGILAGRGMVVGVLIGCALIGIAALGALALSTYRGAKQT